MKILDTDFLIPLFRGVKDAVSKSKELSQAQEERQTLSGGNPESRCKSVAYSPEGVVK